MVDSSSVFSHSKSSSFIPRLAWGVIVQGFIRIIRMALEIPVASKLGISPPSLMQLGATICG